MNVVEVTEFGGPEVLVAAQAPDPVPEAGQVLIGVSAVDVMSIDAQLRAGWGKDWFPARPPFVPGTGVAGRVLAAGAGVDPAWEGRRVAALLPGGGGYAELAVAGVETVVVVPEGVPLWRAAALIQVGPAALSLVAAAGLEPGARVLVIGAGGALGLPIVQLARAGGARVTAAARGPAKRAAALEAGAAEAVGYEEVSGPFDVVFDGVGGEIGRAAFELLERGGRFFAYGVRSGSGAPVDPAEAERRGVRLVGMEQVQFAPDEFGRLAGLTMKELAAGRLTTPVGLALPLERAAESHAALEAREVVGKAVLLVTAEAVRHHRLGGPEVLELEEVPLPQPGAGQVRVRVRAGGVNAIDWKLRTGFPGATIDGPQGTGLDLAGTVDALGPGVTAWRPGDAVYGQGTGTLAAYAIAEADGLVAKPDDLTYEEAAALPVAVETATRTLRELGVERGHTLLIHAVAGGVGLAAAQLARAAGAEVVGTASERHHAFLRGLGVRPVVYGEGLEERLPHTVDRVLDASGRDVLDLSVKRTGDPAKVVTIADMTGANRLAVRFSTGRDTSPAARARALRAAAGAGVRIPVAEVFPLERAADAHRRSQDGHFLGKIVVSTEGSLPH
ncbi:zinc-binding dehydrogenase [Nonomuraea sp. NPDC049646]|uniref:zinc-binding dehydrogenase n=1 Tax=unclassified Nonomuraea TaxID=2593643 RepID=UPI0037973D75